MDKKCLKRKLRRSQSADSFLAKRRCLNQCECECSTASKFAKEEDSEEHSDMDNELEDPGVPDSPVEEEIQSSDVADDAESPASVEGDEDQSDEPASPMEYDDPSATDSDFDD